MPKIQMLIVIYGIFIHAADNAPLPPFTCLPRTDEDPCLPDHELVTCTTNGTQDGCVPCPPGLRMCDATTSELPSKCYDPREACSADGDNRVQVTDLPGGGCTIRCICNESAGFSGDSHHCLPCPENQHNPHDDGLDKCVPRSTRPSTAVNPQQTLLVPSTTPAASSTTTPAASAGLDADNDNDNGDDMQSINSVTDTQIDIGTRWYKLIIGVLIAGIIIIIVGIVVAVWCCCRQNGKTNAENHYCVCCVFALGSNRNNAVVNQGQPVDPPGQPVDSPGQPVDPPGQPVDPPGQPVDPPGQPVDPPGQPVDPPGQPVDPPGQLVDPPGQPVDPPGQPVDPPGQPVDEGTLPKQWTPGLPRYTSNEDLPSDHPPPYTVEPNRPGAREPNRNLDNSALSDSGHMTGRSGAAGTDTTQRKMELGLSAGEFPVPTSQDGPCAMTRGTIEISPNLPLLQGPLETRPKEVVQGHVAEVSETEKKIPVLGRGPVVSQRITKETPVSPQSQPQPQPQAQSQGQSQLQAQPQVKCQAQAQPEVQSQLQGQPQNSVVHSGSHIPGSRPSLGGESLHMSSFNSEYIPTTY